ncbi:MAG: trigger factor [Patescibacteria group bacterium]|nr:trigger factor [Patescibacteria group bacterium]
MQSTTKKTEKGVVELTITVEVDEIKHTLEMAAQEISKEKPIEGYRPGKAGYEVVAKNYSEQAIYEAALPAIVQKYYVQAVKDEKLQTFGEPEINVTKLAAGNTVEFTATVALVPEISQLAEVDKVKVESKTPTVEDKEIDGTIKELQRMQTKEIRATREAQDGDKIVIDMDMSLESVPLDGGQARGHAIYLDQEYYVPGMKEKIIGMKEGETREFTLKFPKEHYQKNIADKDVGFKVTVKEIYELQHPEINDEFAKSLGQENAAKLRELLQGNILKDKQQKEDQRVEIEILEKLSDRSRFGDLPDRMVNMEVDRMVHELEHSVGERGIKFEDYLKSIKKTPEELKLEFATQAVKRIKTALILREYGEKNAVEVSDAEVLEEQQKMMNSYKDNAEAQKQVQTEEYLDYIRTGLRNRKVIEDMREKANVTKK